MTVESGGRGGGRVRPRRKRRKTGTRKSSTQATNLFSSQSGLGGLLGIGGNSIGGGVNNDLLGLLTGASAKPMVKNMDDHIAGITTGKDEPAGGFNMQKVAPQVTMRARPPARPRSKDAQQNSIDILDQLVQSMLTDAGSATYDYESAIQDATSAIRDTYAAEISAIRSNNKAARKSTRKSREEIEAMYKGLAKSYGRQSKRAVRRGERHADRALALGQESNQILMDANSEIANQEAALLAGLGLQEAAPEVLSDNTEQFQNALADNSERANQSAQYAQDFAGTNQRFFQRYKAGAKFEGADRSADLLAALQDYVRQNRNEIASLKGQRAQDIAGSKQEIMNQAASFQSEQDEQIWDRLMDYMDLKRDIEDTNFDNRLDAKEFRWDMKMDKQKLLESVANSQSGENYMPEALHKATQLIANELPRDKANRVNQVFKALLQSDNFLERRFNSSNTNEVLKLTPEKAMQLARQAGRQAGLSQREIEILALAAYSAAEG
jgi:HD-GYP domain-containing protein (c-di-GMP phosphodiesterase class II)